jgi:CHAT domain-containing protein
MPTTPGQPDLPAVGDELKTLTRYFPQRRFPRRGHTDHLVAQKATRNNVLRRLPTCSWLHMACHAYQHPSDPTRSGFALWDEPLTIADLVAEHLNHTELAFLSACQTATGSTRLLDEAIHLAAAMQLLGYRHILATMWTIADSAAPYIADIVYTRLTQGGGPDPSRAAEALHHAVCSLRQEDPTNPLLWAPYIHLGP